LSGRIEQACDAITLEKHPRIRDAKDVAAGAVLLACVMAVVVGAVVFVPYLVVLVRE
jgi:undecaprenol kinase